jgi:hypothetical protein
MLLAIQYQYIITKKEIVIFFFLFYLVFTPYNWRTNLVEIWNDFLFTPICMQDAITWYSAITIGNLQKQIYKHTCDPDVLHIYLHSLYFNSASGAGRNVTVQGQGRFGCLSFYFCWTAITFCGGIEIIKGDGW